MRLSVLAMLVICYGFMYYLARSKISLVTKYQIKCQWYNVNGIYYEWFLLLFFRLFHGTQTYIKGHWNQTMCITQVRIKTQSNKYTCRIIRTHVSNCNNVSVRRRRYSSGTKIRTNCQTNFSSIINIDTFPKDT